MFRIDRTAIALSGLYFILGSHVSCWYFALGLFALSNAVHIINLIAPEEAGKLAREIISLCSTTCIPNSRVSAVDPPLAYLYNIYLYLCMLIDRLHGHFRETLVTSVLT